MSTDRIGTLMLLDDDPVDQRLHRRIIERSGVAEEIVQFTAARDALAYLAEGHRPDAILLDIRMPGMNGFEFLDAALEIVDRQLGGVVVLMLTTSLDPADQERAAGYDVVKSYLYKPLATEDLTRLPGLVGGQRAR